jgi:hypothetical protein
MKLLASILYRTFQQSLEKVVLKDIFIRIDSWDLELYNLFVETPRDMMKFI